MRLAAAILLVLSLLLLAGAAYLGPGRWQISLYLDVIAWTLAVLFLLAALGEGALGPWARALLAALAAGGAAAISLSIRPGTLDEFPFHALVRSGASVSGLGLVVGSVLLGGAAVRTGRKGPGVLGALAIAAAVFAVREWIRVL